MKQLIVRTERCLGCKSCEIACALAHSETKTLPEAILEVNSPVKRVFVETNGFINFPLQCRQCSDTPCVHACMSGAMYVDTSTGLVQLASEKCVGCWMCVMSCPFGVITQTSQNKAAKCDRCREANYEPACVKACPTKALEFVEVAQFNQCTRKSYLVQMA